jgi:CRP-like cAMP-binding protein
MPPAIDDLSQFGLFGGLSSEVMEFLAARLAQAQFAAGDTVFREGDTGRELYIVLSGEMEVLKHSERHQADVRVAVLGPGDWFGEMSVLSVQHRSASVRTLSPALLLKVPASTIDDLYRHDIKAYALFVLNIAREISRRLRVADGILADLVVSVVHRRGSPAG